MKDIEGKGCYHPVAPVRPDDSLEHPNSGAPLHHHQGGNLWIMYLLATLDGHLPDTYDELNFQLLSQGTPTLTLDLNAGISPTDNGSALLVASERARAQLELAGTIQNLSYDPQPGALSCRIQNNTGHKLISGFPEGRRIFVNIQTDADSTLIYEVNPYDYTAGTLKGPKFPGSENLSVDEAYVDELVYEVHHKSDLTGETKKTFHLGLATGRNKDNRIPPKGFDIANAANRLCEPVWEGLGDTGVNGTDYFTPTEYAGGYDDFELSAVPFPLGAESVVVTLYYQGTSREYMEFLRDEINGTAQTLPQPTLAGAADSYIIQTDTSGFFDGLSVWGNTVWDLWRHNHGLDGPGASVPGIVPFPMTQAAWGARPAVINKLKPRPIEPAKVMRIIGQNFGETQGDSVVHMDDDTFDSSSPRIKLWSDTKIKLKIPHYQCGWFDGEAYRKPEVWVTVNGGHSNKKRIKVVKPLACP